MNRLRGFRPGLLAALAMCGALIGCAEEEPGPQFASDPIPSRQPTERASDATPAVLPIATPSIAATPTSMREVLETRGAVPRVFIASNDAIWSVSASGEASRIFQARDGARVLAIDPAPGAAELAALLETQSGGERTVEMLILDHAGKTIAQVEILAPRMATPEAGGVASTDLVDWSPQGDRVIVGLRAGPLYEYPRAADARLTEIDFDSRGAQIVGPEWSPTGETVAFVAADPSGRSRSLRLLNVRDGTVQDIVNPPEGRFVADFTWMPDGRTLLFTEGGELGGAVTGIDLWRIDAAGSQRQLLVSAGTVAPVAQISDMRPSPDGRSVAYVVLVPGTRTPQVDSVWVRRVETGPGFRVPLPSITEVNELWWTDRGLAMSVLTGTEAGQRAEMLALLQLSPDGSVGALWAAPIAVASPVGGTPVATPASS